MEREKEERPILYTVHLPQAFTAGLSCNPNSNFVRETPCY